MAGIPTSSGDQQRRKQAVLDYLSDHLGNAYTAEQLAGETGLPIEEVKVAADALAYEQEIAKERDEGGMAIYRRKA